MKTILRTKIITILLIMMSVIISRSQWINAITHFPINPTETDTIYFYADLSFSSGTCDQHTQFSGVSPPYVYAGALHCLGMLTFICNYTDTFKIDPLPAGNYNFVFHVDAGALPSPCTPGIVAGPTDSIAFTVSSASSVPDIITGDHDLLISPNPAGNIIKLQMSDEMAAAKNKSLVIYSLQGKEIRKWELENGNLEKEINISYLANGMYSCNIVAGNSVSDKVKLIVIK